MLLDRIWIYVLLTTLAVAFLRIGITGRIRSVGRGGGRSITGTIKPAAWRILLAVLGSATLLWLLLDLAKRFAL